MSEGPYESLNIGISTDDEPDRIARNRELLAEAVGRPLAWGHQVHGTAIKQWEGAAGGSQLEQVDGHVTARDDIAPLVVVADCLPVALSGAGQVAMVHCGWRGLAGGIVAKAVGRFAAPPAAVVGPGIGRCCYEVGDEVIAQFEGFADRRMVDLRAVAEDRLRAAGAGNVRHVDLCTSCRPDLFFSHRRDGGVTGRQGGVVWRV